MSELNIRKGKRSNSLSNSSYMLTSRRSLLHSARDQAESNTSKSPKKKDSLYNKWYITPENHYKKRT